MLKLSSLWGQFKMIYAKRQLNSKRLKVLPSAIKKKNFGLIDVSRHDQFIATQEIWNKSLSTSLVYM